MSSAYFISFLVAMLVTMAVMPLLMHYAHRWRMVDLPNARKVHHIAIPRVGGVAMVAGSLLPLGYWLQINPEIAAFIVGISIILLFGVLDDRLNLDYRIKFAGQLVASIVVVVFGDVTIRMLPLFNIEFMPEFVAISMACFFLLSITNAINLTDGLDGLAGGASLLSLGAIGLLGYLTAQYLVALLALTILGSVLGFLRYNTHPAQVFMGDCGSQFLGFSAGVLALMLTQHSHSLLSPALPLLVLGLPILDTVMVMAKRIKSGRSPFKPDKGHIHHKLLAAGLSHSQAVAFIYILQAVLVASAVLMRYQSDVVILGTYGIFCILFLVFIHKGSGLSKLVSIFNYQDILKAQKADSVFDFNWRYCSLFARVLVILSLAGFWVFTILMGAKPTIDVGWLAVVALGMLAIDFLRNRQKSSTNIWWARGGCYLFCVLAVYQLVHHIDQPKATSEAVFFLLLLGAVTIGFRLGNPNSFRMTSLDLILLVIAQIFLLLPLADWFDSGFLRVIGGSLIFFYCTELVLNSGYPRHRRALTCISMLMLATMAVRVFI